MPKQLFIPNLGTLVADAMSHSQQPLVPETVLGGGEQGGNGMLGTLMSLLVAEKVGVKVPKAKELDLSHESAAK